MPHPQAVTLSRNAIADASCTHSKILGLFKAGRPRLEVRYRYPHRAAPTPHVFEVDSPERWLQALGGARRSQERTARELLEGALRDGERERGRYLAVLEQLSFPAICEE